MGNLVLSNQKENLTNQQCIEESESIVKKQPPSEFLVVVLVYSTIYQYKALPTLIVTEQKNRNLF